MSGWETTRHVVAIGGRVADDTTGLPVPLARVVVLSGPRLGAGPAVSRADGSFYFLDLPAGLYRLEATAPGLGTRYGSVQTGPVRVWVTPGKIDPLDIRLPPTRLAGRVSAAADDTPVPGATVRLRGTTERWRTGPDGGYRVAGLPAGPVVVEVGAPKFGAASRAVTLLAGQEQTVDFALQTA
ncbi:hypothetical protein BJY16_007544 [Actinoplanes octamycinicus]|uniref:Carboxypeptidase family protein n=1 Tax=Actinoplanes octamycinicus TaxID=135948 RepID=A0A7W7H4X7_9ACTN|nr:carboxypeptidase-like regulatory domain-containing protein [Actinoplanes octamycinicus]MBB4744085.1 hypothetical protein [Actinoplanes octamycinicus]GIE56958.1 hypothetical protein Aoc01nite_23600 [Actinoplanes octamycinicus]